MQECILWTELLHICGLGESHPGACFHASVTTVKGVTHLLFSQFRQFTTIFYCLIAEAFLCIETAAGKASCGACIYATVTFATTVAAWRVILVDFIQDEQFAEKEHAAGTRNDKLLVAPYPSESRLLCPIALHHGGTVAEGTIFSQFQSLCQLSQSVFHHEMIVSAKAVGCQFKFTVGYFMTRLVVQGHADDGLHSWHKLARIEAHLEIAVEIVHRSIATLREPFPIVMLRLCADSLCP